MAIKMRYQSPLCKYRYCSAPINDTITKFIRMVSINGIISVIHAPKAFPSITVDLDTELLMIKASVPRSFSPDMESKVKTIAVKLNTTPMINAQSKWIAFGIRSLVP